MLILPFRGETYHDFFRSLIPSLALLLLALDAGAGISGTTDSDAPVQSDTRSAEDDLFEKLVTQYKDLTYEQLNTEILPQHYLAELSFDPVSVKYFDRAAYGLKQQKTPEM